MVSTLVQLTPIASELFSASLHPYHLEHVQSRLNCSLLSLLAQSTFHADASLLSFNDSSLAQDKPKLLEVAFQTFHLWFLTPPQHWFSPLFVTQLSAPIL